MSLIFDTHAHYDDEAFDADRETLLASMPEHGVGLILDKRAVLQTVYSLAAETPFAGSLTAWQQRLRGTRSTSNRLREDDFIRLLK